MKGQSLEQATVVILALDGTLVYVEAVEPTFAAVVALPDQPTAREDDRVFTPGRVGAKKISPFSVADKVVAISELSERNKNFIGTFEVLRTTHGNNYVDRTPEELAAHEAANAPKPTKEAKAAERAANKAARKATSGPRFLQRCTVCNEQPGHPGHGTEAGKHEFTAPAAPLAKCAACDEPESDPVHAKDKADGGHKFVASKPERAKVERAPREARVKAERAPRAGKPAGAAATSKYQWTGNDGNLKVLRAVNPKYNEGNSGMAIIEMIKAAGEAGVSPADVLGQPKSPSTIERAQLAFTQLLNADLIVAVA